MKIWWYWAGVSAARLGDEMSGQALLLLGLASLHDTAPSAQLLAALTGAAVVGGPWLGAALDRTVHPGRLLGAALGLYAAGLALVGLLLGRGPFGVVLLVALLAGLCLPAISGGWSAQLPLVVPPAAQARASAFDAATFNLTGLIGPAAAGLLATLLTPWWGYGLVIGLILLALPCALALPRRNAPPTVLPATSLWAESVQVFRALWHSPVLWRVTVVSVISYIGVGILAVLAPLLGRALWGEAGYGGVLLSVSAVGAVCATLLYARWATRWSAEAVVVGTTAIFALALLLLLGRPTAPLVLAAMLIIGLADGPQLAAVLAVRHQEAPPRFRTQVFTIGASMKITAAAGGAALAGWLATFSVRQVVLGALVSQLLALIAFAVLWRWHRRQPGAGH